LRGFNYSLFIVHLVQVTFPVSSRAVTAITLQPLPGRLKETIKVKLISLSTSAKTANALKGTQTVPVQKSILKLSGAIHVKQRLPDMALRYRENTVFLLIKSAKYDTANCK
jgi:hypothetical protein